MKFKLYDKVKIIRDVDASTYPKTATMLIETSEKMIGKIIEIDGIRHKEKYPYSAIANGMRTNFTGRELQLIAHARIEKLDDHRTLITYPDDKTQHRIFTYKI